MSDISSMKPEVSVIMPCLDEETGLGACIEKIKEAFASAQIHGEIIVVDNGSIDRSIEIAQNLGARVEIESVKGYGSAYQTGFLAAKGKYFIMGDADDTYDFRLIPLFLDKLKNENYDFVTGSRYLVKGVKIKIPFLHRVFGNPMLTFILNFLFHSKYTDVYCGFRGFSQDAYHRIRPLSLGMEFNLELAINAALENLRIAEVPIELAPRKGESKLRTFRDGWRSLRMMLLYCPNKVFVIPGFSLITLGAFIHILVLFSLIRYEERNLGVVTSIFASAICIIGTQILSLGLHTKTYSWSRKYDRSNILIELFYKKFTLERGLTVGGFILVSGFTGLAIIFIKWIASNLKSLAYPEYASLFAMFVVIGFHILFTSIFISAMSIKKREVVDKNDAQIN